MLLEHDGREERRLEAVRASVPDDAAKAAQRRALRRRLGVVGQAIQIALDVERRPQPRDQPALARRERVAEAVDRRRRSWLDRPDASVVAATCLRSASTWSGVHSLPVYAFTSVPSASMIAVRRLWVMSSGSFISRDTETPKRDANWSISSRSPVRNVQSVGSAPSVAACFFSTGGVSVTGSKLTLTQVDVPQRRIGLEPGLDRREVPIHQRTERRHRTLRVDERHDHASSP